MLQIGFVTGLRTRAGGRVRVGRVRVRVERKSPAPNPYPCPRFGGFGFDVTTRVLPSSPRQNVLRFVLFVPALLYAVLDYYVFTLMFVLAKIASSLLDDTL